MGVGVGVGIRYDRDLCVCRLKREGGGGENSESRGDGGREWGAGERQRIAGTLEARRGSEEQTTAVVLFHGPTPRIPLLSHCYLISSRDGGAVLGGRRCQRKTQSGCSDRRFN